MDYDAEREKQKSEEIRRIFREIFPLCQEEDLPWAACHIKDFLRNRIKHEVQEQTEGFTCDIARVLCEVTPPKSWMIDMVRIVVNELKSSRSDIKREREKVEDLKKQIGKLEAKKEAKCES